MIALIGQKGTKSPAYFGVRERETGQACPFKIERKPARSRSQNRAQRSGSVLEGRRNGMSELCLFRRSKGYEICADAVMLRIGRAAGSITPTTSPPNRIRFAASWFAGIRSVVISPARLSSHFSVCTAGAGESFPRP
mgnify:CR=1 FL=1